jgi:hypothetical protein
MMNDPHAHLCSLPAPPRGLPSGHEGADASLGAEPAPEGSPLGGREAS